MTVSGARYHKLTLGKYVPMHSFFQGSLVRRWRDIQGFVKGINFEKVAVRPGGRARSTVCVPLPNRSAPVLHPPEGYSR